MWKKSNFIDTEKGVAALELALILPILAILVFGIIDFGRLIHARLVVANVSREGGSLASRNINPNGLITMLQASGVPLNLAGNLGKIYITRIQAGASGTYPNPTVDNDNSNSDGQLQVSSSTSLPLLGLSPAIYNRLVFKQAQMTSDISDVTVVEVFYKYKPITPLPNFIQNILLTNGDGIIIGSRSVFSGGLI